MELPEKYHLFLRRQKTELARERMEVVFRIVYLASEIDKACNGELEKVGLTESRLVILLALAKQDRPMMVDEFAGVLAVSPATATTLVKRLERDGLVTKKRSKEDNRKVYVSMTPTGAELIQKVAESHEAWITALLKDITTSDIGMLAKNFRLLSDEITIPKGDEDDISPRQIRPQP
jgi:DNA-binding MarR family transcriptional regulator